MGALRTWLGLDAWTRFAREHYGKQPFVMPGVVPEIMHTWDWDSLDDALASPAAEVQVVRRGESLSFAAPRSLAELGKLFEREAGVALRNAEHASERVRAIATAIGEDIPGNQRVAVFATPANTHSLAWHFDLDDLFIVQAAGAKTHYMRENTVVPRPLAQNGHTLAAYALETSPTMACRLSAGDFLYVPAGYWHMARADDNSLSISVGVQRGPELPRQPVAPEKRLELSNRIRRARERLIRTQQAAAESLRMRIATLRR